jgi:hypothetical protein
VNDAKQSGDVPFLARWSKKKIEASDTTKDALSAPDVVGEMEQTPSNGAAFEAKNLETPLPEPISPNESDNERTPAPDLPSIDSLTHESDFTGFMGKDVEPGLRNQAMKKLFTDPHYQFEQMDKLDIYLDDYSRPDPIPPEMLRRMYQSKSLFLFEDEEKEEAAKLAEKSISADVQLSVDQAVVTQQIEGAENAALPPHAPEAVEAALIESADANGQLQAAPAPTIEKPKTQ